MRTTNHVEKIKINDVEKKMEIHSIGKHIVWSHLVHGTSQIKSLGAPVCWFFKAWLVWTSCIQFKPLRAKMLNFQLLSSFQKPSETQFWWISLFVGQVHKVEGQNRTNNFPRWLTLRKCRLRAKPARLRNVHGSWKSAAAWFQLADNSSSVELHKAVRLADHAQHPSKWLAC